MSDARTLSIISTHISIPEAGENRKPWSTAPSLQFYAQRKGIICIPALKSPVLQQPNVCVIFVFLAHMRTIYNQHNYATHAVVLLHSTPPSGFASSWWHVQRRILLWLAVFTILKHEIYSTSVHAGTASDWHPLTQKKGSIPKIPQGYSKDIPRCFRSFAPRVAGWSRPDSRWGSAVVDPLHPARQLSAIGPGRSLKYRCIR